MSYLVARTDMFEYFRKQLELDDWSGRKVLDFGGSDGGLIRDPATTIDEDCYWCMDIVKPAIDRGRADYPKAHWLFYDRYSFAYNPGGIPNLEVPDPGERFDIITAYSVFTSTRPPDLLALTGQLRNLLAPGGVFAFTFIDPHHRKSANDSRKNLQWRLEVEGAPDVPSLVARSRGASWCTLLNDTDLYVEDEDIPPYPPEEKRTCHVYFTADRMGELFPGAEIKPPVRAEMQHCCLIRRAR